MPGLLAEVPRQEQVPALEVLLDVRIEECVHTEYAPVVAHDRDRQDLA